MCNRKQFLTGLDRLSIQLTNEQIDHLLLYCRELQKWSKRINLIARNTSAADIVEKHFLDSLTLLPIIQQYGTEQDRDSEITLLDVGTGAGFPGLVLAAVMPELQVTLAEPRQKRVSFLRHIIRTLQLSNVRVADRRIEPGQSVEKHEDGFTFITSRAVAAIDIFLPLIEGVATGDTVVIMMGAADKGSKQSSPPGTGWRRIEERKFTLPFSGHPRILSMLRKEPEARPLSR